MNPFTNYDRTSASTPRAINRACYKFEIRKAGKVLAVYADEATARKKLPNYGAGADVFPKAGRK